MKSGIHPQYDGNAVITCACGAKFKAGSTTKDLKTELCSACHPFYTGKQKLVDSTGQVDKFKKKMEKAKAYQDRNKPKKVEKEEESS
ncbi:MAG: 50S ribosomal protein L31 [Patescibacteria group bacterium]|nr:50S ribosomal protein L31 [Patescibacteria group bacterium]